MSNVLATGRAELLGPLAAGMAEGTAPEAGDADLAHLASSAGQRTREVSPLS